MCSHKTRITRCPRHDVKADAMGIVEMYFFAREGNWPVSGGVLDQADCFLSAYRLLQRLLPE